MPNNNPVRHHHVPKVYLNNFVDKQGKVVVWDKKNRRLFRSSVAGVAVENDFYTLDKASDPYAWERTYAMGIEPLMAKVFKQINTQANMFTQSESIIISAQEKIQLAEIMIVQLLRGKRGREFQKRVFTEQLPNVISKVEQRYGGFTQEQRKQVNQFQTDSYYFKEISNTIVTNPQRIHLYVDLLINRDFIIYRIQGDQEFLTSDNPVMFVNINTGEATPFAHGILDKDVIIYYPISPKLLISSSQKGILGGVIGHKDRCLIDISSISESSFITKMNILQLDQCYSQIYAQSRKTLDQLEI